ncbi:MAG: hypothetical protein K2P95_09550 [Hyphomonadaceae bacterium]|nr:hypothetical protein [Hyphomonadaceae bacterium]
MALAVGAALSGQTVQAQAPAGSDAPVTVGVGQLDSLTRLSFSWPQGSAGVSAKQAGDVLELRFSRAGAPRLAELHSTPPPRLRDIERISRPGAALVLRLELAPQTSHRAFVEGGRVIVDLISPGAAPSPAGVVRATVEQAKDPSPASGVLPVEIVEETDGARVRLRWPRPAKAAAFRRGEAVYILFDSRAVLEIGDVARANRFFSGVSEVRGEGVVGLRFAVGPSIQVSAGAKGSEWSFFLSESVEGERSAAEIEPIDSERLRTGFGELAVNFGRPGVVRWLEDPEIGDRFAAALLEGPALGLDGRKITLEAALLPAAHGAVVEARAEGVAARCPEAEGFWPVPRRNRRCLYPNRPCCDRSQPQTPAKPSTPSAGTLRWNLANSAVCRTRIWNSPRPCSRWSWRRKRKACCALRSTFRPLWSRSRTSGCCAGLRAP